jgi:hypothetical protein
LGVQLARPDLRVRRELVLDAADVEEERLQVLEFRGREREKAGGTMIEEEIKMGVSAICPSERESDVPVEGCPGGLLVLLERVWRWLKVSTGDQGIYKERKPNQ